jgi:hypothetical protein
MQFYSKIGNKRQSEDAESAAFLPGFGVTATAVRMFPENPLFLLLPAAADGE